ncbi:MAG: hypothetical protein ACYC7D_05230 [Nitrososphaerales archaeon]
MKESMFRHGIAKGLSRVIDFIKSRSSVVPINPIIAEIAGEVNFHKNTIKDWGMMYSMVFAMADGKSAARS